MEAATAHGFEANSKLIFKDKMRKVLDDQLTAAVGARKYVSIEDIDRVGRDATFEQKVGLFTVGVLVDGSSLKTSANNKQYLIFVVTDLIRHDALKLNKSLEAAFKDREQFKLA